MRGGTSPNDLGCRVFNSLAISIPNAVATVLTFDSERYDNGGLHSVAANTSRITVPVAGRYLFVASVEWANNVTGQRLVLIRVNGSTSNVAASRVAPVGGDSDQELATIWDMAANDYAEVFVYQDSGGALSVVVAGRSSPEFMAQKIDKGG